MEVLKATPAWRELVERHGTVEPAPRLPVPCWKLERRSLFGAGAYRDLKVSLLGSLLRAHATIWTYYSESPELFSGWRRIAPDAWSIPPHADPDAVYEWLKLGCWVCWFGGRFPDGDAARVQDPFALDELFATGRALETAVVISAFHDNDPWWVIAPGDGGSVADGAVDV